ncbi:MAG: hypothetical protein BroJett031_23560 [Betaproteobacteria bacterium]|nr:MAG: hypothetical protein BroJett031_23560 [Betaproteobacteria bacterium]
MLYDLLWHELEVIKSFSARALSWAAAEHASASAALSGADEERIEAVVLHPHGSYSFEQIVIRSIINELNALCEFAIQNTWQSLTGGASLPNGELVHTATRGTVERELRLRGVEVERWPRWSDVTKIKELSEGFKHRQRYQPFPSDLQRAGKGARGKRVVDSTNVEWFATYELKPLDAAESIAAVEELLRWLREHHAV